MTFIRPATARSGSLFFNVSKIVSFLLVCAFAACANVCTPLSAPANGPFPAVPANGIDGISWSVARVMWTSDQLPGAATGQRIEYASAAEWAANPGVYPHTTALTSQTPASSSIIQSGILSNLLPNTLYHVLAQSNQAGSWCTATDQTFTTLAKPAGVLIHPTLPQPVDTTRPAMNGTHWVYGSNCGTTAGTGYATVTANLQNCLDSMNAKTGDDLGLPPGTYPISQVGFHNSENSVNVTCSTATSTCTQQSGNAPANGTQVVFGSLTYGSVPSPINPGIPYKVINASGSSFQVSYDGINAITLLNAGGTVAFIPWPLTQPKMVIHSTASANQLPPPGVRLGPDALAQYYPYMPNLQAVDPLNGATGVSFLNMAPLTMNVTFENIRFSVDPTVATSTSPTDPVAFKSPIILGYTNSGITYDQVAFDPGSTPTRMLGVQLEGVNNAVVNSYALVDFWQPHYYATAPITVSGNTVTLPPYTWSYVGPSGTKVSCPSAGGTISLTGGTVSGGMYVWTNADCSSTAQITTGLTATTTVPGMTILSAASPAFPTYTYNAPLGGTIVTHAAIPLYGFTIVSGNILDSSAVVSGNFFDPGKSTQASEGAIGITMDGYGPFKIDNNYIKGSGITGVFWAEGMTLGTSPCGWVNPCPVQTIIGNLTVTRNSMTTDTNKFFYDSPNWDGGNRYWRNINENKAGRFTLYDGNIIGPWSAQVGEGQCGLHEEFETSFIQIGNFPPYQDSSDWTFTNNTCLNMPSSSIGTSYGFAGYVTYPYPIRNFLIQNDLFLNNNAYAQTSMHNQPYRSDGHVGSDPTNSSCPQGLLAASQEMEAYQVDHITVLGQGGCQSFFYQPTSDLASGGITNSILNLVSDPGPFAGYLTTGTFFQPNGYYGGSCLGTVASALFACANNFKFAGNVMLATWTNSYPGSQVEYTPSQIATAQSYFTAPYSAYWPNASTLAGRAAQIGWFNTSSANLRLASNSPYISGAKSSIDGLDIGVNMDQLESHQGRVSNVRVVGSTSTTAEIGLYAPDSFACGVDWGTTAFYNGSGTWSRVAGVAGNPDPRVQVVNLVGLPAHGLIYYRVNCAVQQPTGTIQLP